MGEPDFTPFTAAQIDRLYQPLNVAGHELQMGIVSMGNPHAVCVVEDVATAPVAAVGAALQQHPLFPAAVNAGFMQILDRMTKFKSNYHAARSPSTGKARASRST